MTALADPDATAGPVRRASAAPSARHRRGGGLARRLADVAGPADPDAPAQFAVDLLDVDESRIAPGDAAALTALGAPVASPGTGTGGTAAAVERPNARDELWIPIVLIALLVLTVEWLVYERDTLARLRRSIAARLGRSNAPTTGRGG